MKLFIKKNKMLIISVIIIILWVIIACIIYKNDYEKMKETTIRNIEYCKNNYSNKICNKISVAEIPDTLSIFFQLIFNSSLRVFVYFIYPIFIIFSVVFSIYNELKSGYYKNILTRMSYKNYISKLYITSLKSLIILPLFLLILFLGAYILSGGKIIIPTTDTSFIAQEYLNNIIQFGLVYFLNVFLIGWFIINLSYVFVVKSSHIVSAIIGTYLLFWIIWIIAEAVVGFIVENTLHIKYLTNSLALSAFWSYDAVISLPFMVMYAIILVIISTLMVYLVSRNKERNILNAEKTI